MKRIMLVLLLCAMTATIVYTQDESIPPIPPKRSRAARVGAFGGFTPGWLFVDVAPINDFLVPAGGAPLKDNGVMLFGGAGSAYIMFVPNLRVGGVGMGGSIKSTSLQKFSNGTSIRRDAELHVGFGGVTLEYVLPVFERFDIAVGTMLGTGGIDITLRQDRGLGLTWNEEWGNFGSGNYNDPTGNSVGNITRKLSGNYFVWIPSVNFEYALLGWVGLRLGASYVGMSAPSWEVDDHYDLIGVPDKISGKGFMISAGAFVGTF